MSKGKWIKVKNNNGVIITGAQKIEYKTEPYILPPEKKEFGWGVYGNKKVYTTPLEKANRNINWWINGEYKVLNNSKYIAMEMDDYSITSVSGIIENEK